MYRRRSLILCTVVKTQQWDVVSSNWKHSRNVVPLWILSTLFHRNQPHYIVATWGTSARQIGCQETLSGKCLFIKILLSLNVFCCNFCVSNSIKHHSFWQLIISDSSRKAKWKQVQKLSLRSLKEFLLRANNSPIQTFAKWHWNAWTWMSGADFPCKTASHALVPFHVSEQSLRHDACYCKKKKLRNI